MTPREEQLAKALADLLLAIDELPVDIAYDLRQIKGQIDLAKAALKYPAKA